MIELILFKLLLDEAESVISHDDESDDDESEEEMLIFDVKGPENYDKCKNGILYTKINCIIYIFHVLILESDGSNDSGTSSYDSENKNNSKSGLSNIPFIETIKVRHYIILK